MGREIAMSDPVVSRRAFLRITALASIGAACPALFGGCATVRHRLPDAAELSLQKKIAQMLMIGFRGITLSGSEPIVRDIRELGIGAVVLFDYDDELKSYERDIASPQQLAELTTTLGNYAELPLLIAIDQEGGRVARLKLRHGFPPTVSARYLGKVNDPSQTAWFSSRMAETLHAAGINLNFAPVVDLDLNPDNPIIGRYERSFSADPAAVVSHARAFIKAHDVNNVLTCLKHFPGHGSSTADSHKGFVDVTDSWTEKELEPYRVLLGEGNCRVVMTAHIFNRRLDPDYPATLSKATITGLLRQKLGFNGVVVSDDLQMGAIRLHYSFETAVEKAILAGVDVLDICNEAVYDPDAAPRTIELVTRLVQQGVISEERINSSYYRIMALKRGL